MLERRSLGTAKQTNGEWPQKNAEKQRDAMRSRTFTDSRGKTPGIGKIQNELVGLLYSLKL
jgi:hypothetical protein